MTMPRMYLRRWHNDGDVSVRRRLGDGRGSGQGNLHRGVCIYTINFVNVTRKRELRPDSRR